MGHSATFKAISIATVLFAGAIMTSCSSNPVGSADPSSVVNSSATNLSTTNNLSKADSPTAQLSMAPSGVGGPPGYEPAYYNDTTVLINAIEVPQNPTQHAQADFYEVVYPFDPGTGQELTNYWPADPQCNPCDHQGDGITPDDYHDHILDSRPSSPGHGEYNALWHVYVIMPNYTNDANHNAAINAQLQGMLPARSEAEVDAILSTKVDGEFIANEIDTHFYFICDVVGAAAGTHN